MVFAMHILSCHSQTAVQKPEPPIPTSIRLASLLLNKFTIIAVDQPQGRVYCDDRETQRSFRDLRDLAEMAYNWYIFKPYDFYDISISECACPGITLDYEVKRRPDDVIVVYCRKSS
jgi:hypothetical protein